MQQVPENLAVTAQRPAIPPLVVAGLEALAHHCEIGVVLLDRERRPCFACPTARGWLGAGELESRWQAFLPPTDPLTPWQWQGEIEGRLRRLDFQPRELDGAGTLVVIHDYEHQQDLARERWDAARQRNLTRLAPGLIHDLKGPLNSLGVNLEVLRQATHRGGDPRQLRNKQERFFKTLQGELHHLESMLRSLLEWITPAPASRSATLELPPLVERQRQLIMTRARHQRVTIGLHLPPETLRVTANPDYLGQALLDMLLDALETMTDGGRLELEVRRHGQEAVVEIRHGAAGLPRLEHLRQAGQGESRGPSVSARLVEKAGGWLEVEDPPGESTCLRICLPLVGSDIAAVEQAKK